MTNNKKEANDKSLIFTLKFESQSDDTQAYYYTMVDGITSDVASDIESRFDEAVEEYGAENNGDYIDFDTIDTIESILDDVGVKWETTRADYVIYMS